MIVIRQAKRQRAALLLEVVIALTILVAAMGMLGAQLSGGLKITENARQQTRAAQLADRIMALIELDMQIAELLIDLNNSYPGIRFRMVNEQDRLRPHMRIFINNVAIRSLDVELDDSDEIFILQSLSGG